MQTNTNNVNKTCSLLQTNTINVNKTCSLLQTTLDNEEPNIVSEVFSIYPHLTFINVTTPIVDVTSISTQNLFQGRTFNSKLVYFISHEATSIFWKLKLIKSISKCPSNVSLKLIIIGIQTIGKIVNLYWTCTCYAPRIIKNDDSEIY
jgi:hypothetical protein